MDIRDYARILRRLWWVVVVGLVIGLLGGVGFTFVKSNSYQSCARLFVSTSGGTSVGEAYQNNLFSTDRVKTYAGLATTAQVIDRAAAQLKTSESDLAGKITAAPIANTALFEVCAKDGNANTARDLAGGVSGVLTQVIQELETSVRGGTPGASATLVDNPQTGAKVSPSLTKDLLFGGVGGLVLGLIVAIAWGLADRSVHDRRRVADAAGKTVLAGLPRSAHRPTVQVLSLAPTAAPDDVELAEAVRALATSLRFFGAGTPPRVIAVTGPARGEGRTTVAIDLAAALGDAGNSVALVGGDLRRADLAERLGLANTRGLSTVLAGTDALDAALIANAFHGVTVLPSGPVPVNPSELLGSDQVATILADLGARFRYVIVDTPGLLGVSDGAVLAAVSDGALLLAANSVTSRTALADAVRVLDTVGATVLGTVVTLEKPTHGRGAPGGSGAETSAPAGASPAAPTAPVASGAVASGAVTSGAGHHQATVDTDSDDTASEAPAHSSGG